MLKSNAPELISKPVEVDETFIGGKERNKHKRNRQGGTQGRSYEVKTPVLGMLERGGKVIAKPVKDTVSNTLLPVMRAHVKEGTVIYTDDWGAYRKLSKDYVHFIVNHSYGIYVDGNAHTNSIEGFWSIFKRGIVGIYHHVSPKHLDKYCDEFAFRYNTRKVSETKRFEIAVGAVNGKRIKYEELVA